eukprot:3140010-Rhodomonas_salina.1
MPVRKFLGESSEEDAFAFGRPLRSSYALSGTSLVIIMYALCPLGMSVQYPAMLWLCRVRYQPSGTTLGYTAMSGTGRECVAMPCLALAVLAFAA